MIRNIYILLLLAFGLSQGNSLTNFQNKDYTNNRFGSCISESRMQEIQAQIKLNIQSLKAQGKIDPNIFNKDRVQFSFPLQVSDNYDAYNYWGIWKKIRFSIISLCCLFMIWFYYYWNILGFNYL